MGYVKVRNGEARQYPITSNDVINANPHGNFDRGIVTEKHFRDYGCFPVVEVPKPINDVVVELPPVKVGGEWVQVWEARAFTSEEAEVVHSQLASDLKYRAGVILDSNLAKVTGGYTVGAVASWDQQKIEADAFILDPQAQTPLVDALAISRGIDKAELVSRILANSQGFAAVSGHLLGREQAIGDLIDAATTLEELHRIETEELDTGWGE